MDGESRELRDVSRLIRYAVYDFSIQDTGTGTIKLPKDYKYRDGDPGERIGAKSLSQFGKTVKVSTRSKQGEKIIINYSNYSYFKRFSSKKNFK